MDATFYWSCAVFIVLKKRFSKLKNSNNLKKHDYTIDSFLWERACSR